MKGTLISFDFVKDSNDDIKFLEMNTDTTISATALENCISWEFFLNHLSASSISQIDVIYKRPYHGKLVNHLSASVVESAPFITTFNRHEEAHNSIFPVSLDDASDKFILRMAYDDNAIVDNTYCAVGSEPLRLLNEINSSSLAVPFFYTGSEGEFDTLIEQSNPANIPDVVLKTKRDGLNGVKFAKVQDWSTFRSTYGDDYYITNYGISSSSLNTEQTVSSFRHYTIAYGGGLEMLDLGGYKQYAEFTLPAASDLGFEDGSNEILNTRHYYEYSTSDIKVARAKTGIFTTEKLLDAQDIARKHSEISVGDDLKAWHIDGQPDTEDFYIFSQWNHSGKTLPNNYFTSASVISKQSKETTAGVIFEILPEQCSPIYVDKNTSIITYSTGSDSWSYQMAHDIKQGEHFLPGPEDTLVAIEENNFTVFNEQTGSIFKVDVESTDNVIVESESSVIFAIHNNKVITDGYDDKSEPPK